MSRVAFMKVTRDWLMEALMLELPNVKVTHWELIGSQNKSVAGQILNGKIVGVQYRPTQDLLYVTIESSDFPDLNEGALVPELILTFKEIA